MGIACYFNQASVKGETLMLVRVIFFIVAALVGYALLRRLSLGRYQLRFCSAITVTALFLGIFFGRYALGAVIAMIIFTLGGLLALDQYERR